MSAALAGRSEPASEHVARGSAAAPQRPHRSRSKRKKQFRWTPYLFLGPGVVYLVLFQGIPMLQELRLSFTRTSLLNPSVSEWVGLDNYRQIFTSPEFQSTLWTTLVYVLVCVIGSISIGLGTALLLNGAFRGRAIARALIAVPWAAPAVAVAVIATWMLNAQYGIVNRALNAFGMGVPGGEILTSQTYALPAILITTVWQLFPFSSIVLLAALQSVPQEVKEAATMDGAGRLWSFRVVTWPVIRPTVGLLALLMTIWSIRRFEIIWIMTKGGPLGATRTIVIDLYHNAFEVKQLGVAAAIGMVGVVISLIVVTASQILAYRAERKDA